MGGRGLSGRAGRCEWFPGTGEGLEETAVGFHILSFLEPQDRWERGQPLPLASVAIFCFVSAGLQLLVFTNTKQNDRTTLPSDSASVDPRFSHLLPKSAFESHSPGNPIAELSSPPAQAVLEIDPT